MSDFAHRKLAAVLSTFAAEHGTPNRIGPQELSEIIAPPDPFGCRLSIGKIFRRQLHIINALLETDGLHLRSYEKDKTSGRMLAEIVSKGCTSP